MPVVNSVPIHYPLSVLGHRPREYDGQGVGNGCCLRPGLEPVQQAGRQDVSCAKK